MRNIWILFVCAAILLIIALIPKKRLQKEGFVEMDTVMDTYCKNKFLNKDEYDGPWDGRSSPECILSECPSESCYVIKNNFLTGENVWTQSNVLKVVDEDGNCVTNHNGSNMICDGTRPATYNCGANVFGLGQSPDERCCAFDPATLWTCKGYNNFLNENGQCEFRERYGTNTMRREDCQTTYPVCDAQRTCPDRSVKRQTYDSQGECAELEACDSCTSLTQKCYEFDPMHTDEDGVKIGRWYGQLYKQGFDKVNPTDATLSCEYWSVNVKSQRELTPTGNERLLGECNKDQYPSLEATKQCVADITNFKVNGTQGEYEKILSKYKQRYTNDGNDVEWIDPSNDPIDEKDIPTGSDCEMACPRGTVSSKVRNASRDIVDGCSTCDPNNFYFDEEYSLCKEHATCKNNQIRSFPSSSNVPDDFNIKFYTSMATCSNCPVNHFNKDKKNKCVGCIDGDKYYTNGNACSVCSGRDQYIVTDGTTGKRTCARCPPPTNVSNGTVYRESDRCVYKCNDRYHGGGEYVDGTGYPNCYPKCTQDNYFDTETKSCSPCPSGQLLTINGLHSRTECDICDNGEYLHYNGFIRQKVCKPCPVAPNGVSVKNDPNVTNNGNENIKKCYVECGDNKAYYDGSRYNVSRCGTEQCNNPSIRSYYTSPVSLSSTPEDGFEAKQRLEKSYAKSTSGIGNCVATTPGSYRCPSSSQFRDNGDYFCCAPLTNTTVELGTTPNGKKYCKCKEKQPGTDHKTVYTNGRCVQECAPNDTTFTYEINSSGLCEKRCKDNYYMSNGTCEGCPDSGKRDANTSGNQSINTCYKEKTTVDCGTGKRLDPRAPNKIFYDNGGYDEYCMNECPSGFNKQSNSYSSLQLNIDKYKYNTSNITYDACPSYDIIESSATNMMVLHSQNKDPMIANAFDASTQYYQCQMDGDTMYKQERSTRAACCPSGQVGVFDSYYPRCGVEKLYYSLTPDYQLSANINKFTRVTHTSDTDYPNQYDQDIDKRPLKYKNVRNDIEDVEPRKLTNNEYQTIYQCKRDNHIILENDNGDLQCCSLDLSHENRVKDTGKEPGLIEIRNNVCTVKCERPNGKKGITFNGNCYLEPDDLSVDKYYVDSGDWTLKMYSTGIGTGNPQTDFGEPIYGYINIGGSGGTNTFRVEKTDGTSLNIMISTSNGGYIRTTSTGGPQGIQGTILVKDGDPNGLRECLIILTDDGDAMNGDIYYPTSQSFGGGFYFYFKKLPIGTRTIPSSEPIVFVSLSGYDDDERTDQTCPVPPSSYNLNTTTYQFGREKDCNYNCTFDETIKKYYSPTLGEYHKCPKISCTAVYKHSDTSSYMEECVMTPQSPVEDYQECLSHDTPCTTGSWNEIIPNQKKIKCKDGYSYDLKSKKCIQTCPQTYTETVASEVNSIGGDNKINYTYTTYSKIANAPETVYPDYGETCSGGDTDSTATSAECSDNGVEVASTPFPDTICCSASNDNVTLHNGTYYCCPSNEEYNSTMDRCVKSNGCGVILVDGTNEECYNEIKNPPDPFIVLKIGIFYVNKNYNLDSSISTTYENQLILDVENKKFITLKNRKGAYVEDTNDELWNRNYSLSKIYQLTSSSSSSTSNKILLGVNDANSKEHLVTYSNSTPGVIQKQKVMNNSVTKFDYEVVNRCSTGMEEFELPSTTYTCRNTECPTECKYQSVLNTDSYEDMSSDPQLYYIGDNVGDHCYKQKDMTYDATTGKCTTPTYVTCSSPSNDLIHNDD